MDYRIQGKILPRILDMEEYLQKFKQAEAEVVPSSSSVEVGLEVGVDYCPPWIRTAPKHYRNWRSKILNQAKITKNNINSIKSTIKF